MRCGRPQPSSSDRAPEGDRHHREVQRQRGEARGGEIGRDVRRSTQIAAATTMREQHARGCLARGSQRAASAGRAARSAMPSAPAPPRCRTSAARCRRSTSPPWRRRREMLEREEDHERHRDHGGEARDRRQRHRQGDIAAGVARQQVRGHAARCRRDDHQPDGEGGRGRPATAMAKATAGSSRTCETMPPGSRAAVPRCAGNPPARARGRART
jgi:hypothetical protein